MLGLFQNPYFWEKHLNIPFSSEGHPPWKLEKLRHGGERRKPRPWSFVAKCCGRSRSTRLLGRLVGTVLISWRSHSEKANQRGTLDDVGWFLMLRIDPWKLQTNPSLVVESLSSLRVGKHLWSTLPGSRKTRRTSMEPPFPFVFLVAGWFSRTAWWIMFFDLKSFCAWFAPQIFSLQNVYSPGKKTFSKIPTHLLSTVHPN